MSVVPAGSSALVKNRTARDLVAVVVKLPGEPAVFFSRVRDVESVDVATGSPLDPRAAVVTQPHFVTLPAYASSPHKDSRAPQNLVPIGGLERSLRRLLGDGRLMQRALREAASAPAA